MGSKENKLRIKNKHNQSPTADFFSNQIPRVLIDLTEFLFFVNRNISFS